MYDVYIAGSLTICEDPDARKQFFENIAKVCESCGLSVYLFHKHTDPKEHPEHTPRDVYERNYNIIANAKFVIAYVGEPALGVGMELEIAKNNNTEVILLYSNQEAVSRMARGNPSVVETITYDSEGEALEKLAEFLTEQQKNY
jgi:hypothetical protein